MEQINPYSSPSACERPCRQRPLRRAVTLSVAYALSMLISCALIERLFGDTNSPFTNALFKPVILVLVITSFFYYFAFGATLFPELWSQPALRHALAGVATSALLSVLCFAMGSSVYLRRYSELVPEPYGRFLLTSIVALAAVSGILLIWTSIYNSLHPRLNRHA